MIGAHHTPRGFRNLDSTAGLRPPLAVLRWMLSRRKLGIAPEAVPARAYPSQPLRPGAMRVFWIGHSSVLVEFADGPRILIDPVFSDTCSPLPPLGPKRFHPPGLSLDSVLPVDAILISHNHYDHLDAPTIREILRRTAGGPRIIVPLRLGPWFARIGAKHIEELDWWESTFVAGKRITSTPAQHWSKRGFTDSNRSLWCGYRLDHSRHSFYFAGDSGYFAGYREIGERLGPVEIAALPIGAYEPRWFMKVAHQSPEEAVQAYRDVRAQTFMAVHHNTFPLTDEPPDEPARRLQIAWERAGYAPGKLWIPQPGEDAMF